MIPPDFIRPNGSLRPHSLDEVNALGLGSRGIRDGSNPSLTMALNQAQVTLKYMANPDQFWSAMLLFLGATVRYTDPATGTYKLSRLMPYSLYARDMNRVAITHVRVKGFRFLADEITDGIPIPTHKKIELELTAEALLFETAPDEDVAGDETRRYVETYPDEDSAEYLNMPGVCASLQFLRSDNNAALAPHKKGIPYNVGIPIIKSKVRRKWYRIPKQVFTDTNSPLLKRLRGDPAAGTRPYVGSMNKTPFLGYPAGTLVLLAPKLSRSYDPVLMDYCYNVMYEWDYIPNGASNLYYFDPNKGPGNLSGWYQASRADTWKAVADLAPDDTLFPPMEHADIFNVGTI